MPELVGSVGVTARPRSVGRLGRRGAELSGLAGRESTQDPADPLQRLYEQLPAGCERESHVAGRAKSGPRYPRHARAVEQQLSEGLVVPETQPTDRARDVTPRIEGAGRWQRPETGQSIEPGVEEIVARLEVAVHLGNAALVTVKRGRRGFLRD